MADLFIAEKSAVVVRVNAQGRRTRVKIREGKLYRADDPAVQGREHMFRPVIEQATAEPGEKRSIGSRRRRPDAEAAQAPAPASDVKAASDAE